MRSGSRHELFVAGGLSLLAGVSIAGALLVPNAFADTKPDPGAAAKGEIVYVRYCVSCHGRTGRGDGPVADDLRVPVPDLSTLAARNSEVFPFDRVARIIEISEPLRGHGTPDMPAWGDAFKKTKGTESATPKQAIHNLTHFLRSLQRDTGQ